MSLERLIRLVRKTGDRLVVHDPQAETDVVIMDLAAYETLLDLDESPSLSLDVSRQGTLEEEETFVWPDTSEEAEIQTVRDRGEAADDFSWTSTRDVIDGGYGHPTTQADDAIPKRTEMNSADLSWDDEEPLSDEPVFYEEPV